MISHLFVWLPPEIDISVSKLLGFETFAKFLRVSKNLVSVLENLVPKKSLSFGFGKFGLGKSLGFGVRRLGLGKEKNQNNKKETRPSKQCKSLI